MAIINMMTYWLRQGEVAMIEKILLRVPISVKNKLRGISNDRGLTLNAYILEILWKHIEAMEMQSPANRE